MKDYSDIRILLNITLPDRQYRYSDRDGPAYQISSSEFGRVIVSDEILQYKGVINNSPRIKDSVKVENNSPSVGNVKVEIWNTDRLDRNNTPAAIESADAEIFLVVGDNYDDILASFKGKIDEVAYDTVKLSFSIKSEEVTLFRNVPETVFEEDTFQYKLVFSGGSITESDQMDMRFGSIGGVVGHTSSLQRTYAKTITHPALGGKSTDFWKGARIDVVDAEGALGDPRSESFAIGEFAVVIKSSRDEITLPTVLDRYLVYTFIDQVLRENSNSTPATGTLTALAKASLSDLDYFVLNDGIVGAKYFFFDVTGGATIPAGGIQVNISADTTALQVAVTMAAAINGVTEMSISAENPPTAATFTLTHDNDGPIGNIPITELLASGTLTPTGMDGGGPTNSYDMTDVINNTMRNAPKGGLQNVKNGDFDSDTEWTKGTGWAISAGVATKTPGTASDLSQYVASVEAVQYDVTVTATGITAGSLTINVGGGASSPPIISNGIFKHRVTAESTNKSLIFSADTTFDGSIDEVKIETANKPYFQIIKNPIPENADSVGRPFPIVYGNVEKMEAVWAMSSKSTRQNSLSAGDDIYIIAGHKITDRDPTEILVYFGLDENAQGMNFKPGTIDYVPNPLPRSIYEVDHWNEPGYSLRHPTDEERNVSPFHKLIEVYTNKGDIVTAIQLRGTEYDGWDIDNSGSDNSDGDLPAVNGQPQFPIRYGLGNSRIFCTFRGYNDEVGAITGVPGSLIEHPIDILKHFMLNHTNIDGDNTKINEQSFADSRARLENWRFGVVINDVVNGKDVVNRIARQCKSVWYWKDGQFFVKTFDLDNPQPNYFLDATKHIIGSPKWKRKRIRDIYNDFIFNYGYNSVKSDYDRVVVRNKTNDQACRDSFSQYGFVRSLKAVDLPDIYDSYTANSLSDHFVSLHAKQRRTMEVDLRITEETANLSPTDVVAFSFETELFGVEWMDDIDRQTYIITDINTSKNVLKASMLELGSYEWVGWS